MEAEERELEQALDTTPVGSSSYNEIMARRVIFSPEQKLFVTPPGKTL